MSTSTIYTNTDGTLTVTGLTLRPSHAVVTGATVTGTLKDSTGTIVTNWDNLVLSDQGGGTYQVSFTAANVPPTGTYAFTVVAVKAGLTLTVEHDLIVQNLQS